jgi:hypothetical protein
MRPWLVFIAVGFGVVPVRQRATTCVVRRVDSMPRFLGLGADGGVRAVLLRDQAQTRVRTAIAYVHSTPLHMAPPLLIFGRHARKSSAYLMITASRE